MSTFGGDSYDGEHRIQKLRQMEVIGTFIPEDEASRLANGKVACLVCPSCPVFPTMPSLAVHRSGKKHKQHAASFVEKKEELKNESMKRQMDQLLRQGNNSLKSASSKAPAGDQPLLTSTKKKTLNALSGRHHSSNSNTQAFGVVNTAPSGSFFQPAYANKDQPSKSSNPPQKSVGAQFAEQFYAAHPQPANSYGNFGSMQMGEIPYNSLAYQYQPTPSTAQDTKKRKVATAQLDPTQLEEVKKRERLFEKGWRWDASGKMYRDESVEWESDEDEIEAKDNKNNDESNSNANTIQIEVNNSSNLCTEITKEQISDNKDSSPV